MLKKDTLKFAIPNKGRLSERSVKILEKIGIRITGSGDRKLFGATSDPDVQVLFVRAEDIPKYVEMGAADIGITGYDLVKEKKARVKKLNELPFGYCSVCVASRDYHDIDQLKGKRVATSFPNIAKEFFKKNKVKVDIVEISGAAEITPHLGVAEAIVDLVSSGTTLEMNGLRVIERILESSAVVIANKDSMEERKRQFEKIELAISGMLLGEKKKYVMMNVEKKDLEKVLMIVPSMRSPTVLHLANEEEVAIHVVIDKDEISQVMHDLKVAGAKDILVLSTERVTP